MNAIISAKFSELENSRLSLLKSLGVIPSTRLESPPRPGKWSVSQIFYHLNKAESFSTIYVSKKRLDINNLKKTGLKEGFKLGLLKFLFVLPFNLKAPVKVLGNVPDKVVYQSIVDEWSSTRDKLKSLLDSLPDEMLYKNVFKQPAIGRINIFQMLDFMQSHFDRHERQIERIVKSN